MIDTLLARLVTMLSYQRPAGSPALHAFVDRWILPLGARPDGVGNWSVKIGDTRMIYTAHLDTVHQTGGSVPPRIAGEYLLSRNRAPLGADDTVGCFLMHEMVRRRVPGTYYWHDSEERSCAGSRAVVDGAPSWLADYDHVVSLDRRGTSDVVTHQCGRRTCSDAFADAVSAALNAQGMRYCPSAHGLYTDSEVYASTIAECTNLSVGYDGEHSPQERVHVPHVFTLLDALTDANLACASLPVKREATADAWYGLEAYLNPNPDWRDDLRCRIARPSACELCEEPTLHLMRIEGLDLCATCASDTRSPYLDRTYADVVRSLEDPDYPGSDYCG